MDSMNVLPVYSTRYFSTHPLIFPTFLQLHRICSISDISVGYFLTPNDDDTFEEDVVRCIVL